MGVTHGLSEVPITSRKRLIEHLIDTFGQPEVRTKELVWNPELIGSREAREHVYTPHKTKTKGAFGRERQYAKDNDVEAAARELGIDLSGVRAS